MNKHNGILSLMLAVGLCVSPSFGFADQTATKRSSDEIYQSMERSAQSAKNLAVTRVLKEEQIDSKQTLANTQDQHVATPISKPIPAAAIPDETSKSKSKASQEPEDRKLVAARRREPSKKSQKDHVVITYKDNINPITGDRDSVMMLSTHSDGAIEKFDYQIGVHGTDTVINGRHDRVTGKTYTAQSREGRLSKSSYEYYDEKGLNFKDETIFHRDSKGKLLSMHRTLYSASINPRNETRDIYPGNPRFSDPTPTAQV